MKQAPMQRRTQVRYAANPLDYKKMILDRSVEPNMFYKPRDPRVVYPRKRNIVSWANR